MIIEVQDLTKTYNPGGPAVVALNGLSLAVQTGEFVAVRGVSGCGKSTLLHILGLLATADSGQYRFCGEAMRHESDESRAFIRNRMIGFIFQHFHLLSRVSVLDNVALPAVYQRGRPDVRRALECLDMAGVADLAKRRPNQLSGGQQQRVAIARALMHDPVLLLADEPTGNLDSASAESILEALETLHRQGTTLLMVTHEADVAARAQRQVVLCDGRVIADTAAPNRITDQNAQRPVIALTGKPRPLWAGRGLTCMHQALRALRAHLGRAALAALGILAGTFALMMTILLIAGARESISRQMEALGTNLLIVTPQPDRSDRGLPPPRLTLTDAQAVAALPGVLAAAGTLLGRAELSLEGGASRTTPIVGAEAGFAGLSANQPEAGRFFTQAEVEHHARVVLLGATPARALFGHVHPLGHTLLINGFAFRVIGLMPERGVNPWRDPDDIAVIPITTAMRPLLGRQELDQIHIEIDNPVRMEATGQAVLATLSRRHPAASDPERFRFRDMSHIRRTFEDITAILSGLLLSVSVLSLLVGGIGIMNIMLVAVTERTREVGLRKALGARIKDVMAQFLAEAVLLSLAGGAIGVTLGFTVLHLMRGMGVSHAWVWMAAAASFTAAGFTGIVFGLWPAARAAHREPVEALRHE